MGLKNVITQSLLLNFHLTLGSCLGHLKHYLTAKLRGSIHLLSSPEVLPNRFADYFEQKITNIRAELDFRRTELRNPSPDVSQEHSHVQLRHFTPVTTTQLGNLIGRTARKSCDLDPVPATVLRTFAPIATAHLYCVRYSLSTHVPRHFQAHALSRKLNKNIELVTLALT